MSRKPIILAFVGIIALVVIAYILNGVAPRPESSQSLRALNAQYLSEIRTEVENPGVQKLSDEEVIALGQAICDSLDDGARLRSIVVDFLTAGVSVDDTGTIIGTSIELYCPEYNDQVNSMMRA